MGGLEHEVNAWQPCRQLTTLTLTLTPTKVSWVCGFGECISDRPSGLLCTAPCETIGKGDPGSLQVPLDMLGYLFACRLSTEKG